MTEPHSTDRLISALLDERDRRIEVEGERNQLRHRIEVLDRKLLELSDPARQAPTLRDVYRRGYRAGRASQRRGASAVTNPERAARGWMREALAEGKAPYG